MSATKLPSIRFAAKDVHQQSKRTSLSFEELKVLIVDDDASVRRLLRGVLEREWPCQVIEAGDGLEALNWLLSGPERPDLVVLDVMMPRLSGLDLIKIIRMLPSLTDLPVLICSSCRTLEKVQEIASYRVEGYVVKPIDRNVLIKKILKILLRTGKWGWLEFLEITDA